MASRSYAISAFTFLIIYVQNVLILEKREAIDQVLKMGCFSSANERKIKLHFCIQMENDMFDIGAQKSAYSLQLNSRLLILARQF